MHATEATWRDAYAQSFPLCVSVMAVLERMRGHLLAELHAEPSRRTLMEQKTREYFAAWGQPGRMFSDLQPVRPSFQLS